MSVRTVRCNRCAKDSGVPRDEVRPDRFLDVMRSDRPDEVHEAFVAWTKRKYSVWTYFCPTCSAQIAERKAARQRLPIRGSER